MGNLRVEAPHWKCRKLGHHFTTMSVFVSHCCWAALDCKLWCQKQQISLADSCVTCRCRVRGYWRIRMHKSDWRRVGNGMEVWFQNRVAAPELLWPPAEHEYMWNRGRGTQGCSFATCRQAWIWLEAKKKPFWLEEENKCEGVNQSGVCKQWETCGKSAQNGSKTKPSFAEPSCRLQDVEPGF